MFDYETLRLAWWLLLGVLLAGFAVTDGYDLGAAALLRLLGRDEVERRMVLAAIEPHWEGHQVWFILGGGAIFAAWPLLYAASFSGFYFAMMLVLLALILRPVGFAFRDKSSSARWRSTWDWALTASGLVPALVFGVAFGNLFLGVPFHFTDALLPVYDGGFFALFRPLPLACGALSLAMLAMHGANFVAMKVEAPVGSRARRIARIAAAIGLALFVGCGLWLFFVAGFVIRSPIDGNAMSNPFGKRVDTVMGAWLAHHGRHPVTLLLPVAGALAFCATLAARRAAHAFVAGGIAVAMVVFSAGVGLFPFLLPSATDPSQSLTVWDASSSQTTLGLMLVATAVLLPIVLAYSAWAFRLMRGGVTRAQVESGEMR